MGDYYHHFLSSMSGVAGAHGGSPQESYPPAFPGAPHPVPGSGPQAYQNFGYFAGYPEPLMYNAPKSQKNRRKAGQGFDHVKHRRTRSGCFMCRSRRVKCDETRPICDRCRKGSRECIYPDPPPGKGSISQTSALKDASQQQPSPGSSCEAEEQDPEDETEKKLETILDEDESAFGESSRTSSQPASAKASLAGVPLPGSQRRGAPSPGASSQEGSKGSPAASTETSSSQTATVVSYTLPDQPSLSVTSTPDWSHLSPDVQRYLNYFCQSVTHHHYCMTFDGDDFFHGILPNFAIHNEALLNAVVGFSAYIYTLENSPNGKISEFLQYYNKTVTLLLASLKRKEKPTIASLLTILQLATIEEYLGDWINLMGHQKAAHEIITKLFTPQSAVQTPLGRMVVSWYSRFDVFIGIMGGFPTTLTGDWLIEYINYCQYQLDVKDGKPKLQWKIEREVGRLRFISREMSMLFARGSRGQISADDFAAEHERLLQKAEDWRAGWDPELLDPEYLVTDFSYGPPMNESDIVNPYTPGLLYREPHFATTLLTLSWLSVMIMHKCQSSTMPRERLYVELAGHCYTVCTIFELIERWPGTPPGGLIAPQASIAISALFMPQDAKHHMWFRRKFALLETKGYIHPITLRHKLGELFNAPSCAHWWLPNEEGYTPILHAVRNLADERNAAAINAQEDNLREVRHIFAKLEISDDAEALSKGKTKIS